MSTTRRLLNVLAVAVLAAVPGGLAVVSRDNAPPWYLAALVAVSACTLALPGLGLGLVALFAGRDRPGGGLKPALILAGVVGLALSASLVKFTSAA